MHRTHGLHGIANTEGCKRKRSAGTRVEIRSPKERAGLALFASLHRWQRQWIEIFSLTGVLPHDTFRQWPGHVGSCRLGPKSFQFFQ
jgi:hypothetical protein